MHDKDITDFLLYEMPQVETQVTVLLGAGAVSGAIARAGAMRYKQGLSQKFILSGGVSTFQPHVYAGLALYGFAKHCLARDFFTFKREANYMADILSDSGVPDCDIVFKDTQAKNTGENFKNISAVMAAFNTAAIITSAHHQRRAIATALKVLPSGAVPHMVTYGVYPFGVNRDNWTTSPLARYVRAEALKTDPNRAGQKGNYVGSFCVALSDDTLKANLKKVISHHATSKSCGPR